MDKVLETSGYNVIYHRQNLLEFMASKVWRDLRFSLHQLPKWNIDWKV
jgi:hypothetical protein